MKPRLLAAVVPLLFLPALRAEEPKPLPPELRWIPADSVGFVHVRVGEIVDSRAGKAAFAFLKGADTRSMEEFEREFGVAIDQIDRLTLVLPDIEADSRTAVVLRLTTREPYDRAKVVAALRLQDRPDRPKGLGGDKKLFARGFDRLDREYVHLTDAKTITHLIGDGGAGLLGKLLEGETSGRLSPALEAAAKGDQFVAAIDANRLRVLPNGYVSDEFGPLLDAGLAMIRGRLTEGGADLHLWAGFPNEERARAGRQHLVRLQEDILREMGGAVEPGRGDEEPMRRQVLEPILSAVKAARFEIDRGTVTGTTSIAAKRFVEFMEKEGARAVAAEAERRKSQNNLKQIALAMHNYESAQGFLPTQSIKDRDGKPLLSWRVALLPYIEEDALYKEFRLDEPWNSEHNKKLIARLPVVYRVPGKKFKDDGKTAYLVPVGPNTIFPPDAKRGLTLGRITGADGTANTIFVVQANDESAVVWTKPDDLVIDAKDPMKGLRRNPGEAIVVVMGDGATRTISPRLNPKQLLNAFDWRDGQFLNFNDLTGDGK